jgi:hypothetical protein
MFEIDFNRFDHNFCESTIYSTGPHPEYLNAVSSLFITFIGLNALRKPDNDFFLQLLYSALAVNGITSCVYHWVNNIGWGLLDRMSMIIIAMSSIYLFMLRINKIIIQDKWKHSKLLMSGIHLLVCGYFTTLFTIAGLHMESVFNVLFGLFLASLVVFMWLVNKHIDKNKAKHKAKHIDNGNLKITDQIVKFGWDGIKYIALSGTFWIVTENLCSYIWFIKYLFGHVMWHVFVSYGGYLLSMVPKYLTLYDKSDINESDKSNESNNLDDYSYECSIELGKTIIPHTIHIKYDCFCLPYICTKYD